MSQNYSKLCLNIDSENNFSNEFSIKISKIFPENYSQM